MVLSDFQQQLKDQTKELHAKAEQHPLMQDMINGNISKQKLIQFLVNLYPIYFVVEQRLLTKAIKNNPELKRTELIENDIQILTNEIINTDNLHLLSPLPCTCIWVSESWIKSIELLKAELYCRWLADLYGGRLLVRTVAPNSMYICEDYQLTINSVRTFLDKTDLAFQKDIIKEAVRFFNYHIKLFDTIYYGQ